MGGKRMFSFCIAALSMVVLILDAETALISASEGIEICIKTVIPSLFPFFFLSVIINQALAGMRSPILRPLTRLCGLQEGTESVLLLGLLGGYPVGAASVILAYSSGNIGLAQAQRMLSFCNNAGPAFIFGMMSALFDNKAVCWAIWGIHILSAVAVGAIMPRIESKNCILPPKAPITVTQALKQAVSNISVVCGWIVVFRIVYGFCSRWFLWLLPENVQVFLCGILELANGCISLSTISDAGIRFMMATVFLSFGGICVGMQTASVIGQLSVKTYWQGKLMQTAITLLFAEIMRHFLFPEEALRMEILLCLPGIVVLLYPIIKKAVAFPKIMRYNRENSLR